MDLALESELAAGERALLEDADLAVARRHFAAAGRVALALGDNQALSRAALGLGGLWVHEQRTAVDSARVAAWLRKAEDGLPVDSPLAARLHTRLAAEQDYVAGTSAGILECVAEARAAGDPIALAEALNLAHHCLLGPQHAELRLTLAEEQLATAAMTGRTLDELLGLLWWTVDLFLLGDAHAERAHRATELAAAHPLRAVDFILAAQEGMLAIRRGDFAAAEARAAACASDGHQAGDLDAVGWYAAQIVTVRWFQGRIGELPGFLAELVHSPTLGARDNSLFSALAVAAATAGDRPTAVTALRTARIGSPKSLQNSSTWLVTLAGVAEAACLLGDVDTATEAYALLEPYAELPVMASLGISCFGSAHQALGVAALTMGDLKRAAEHFGAAVAANERLGHLPAAELSRRRLAEVRAMFDGGAEVEPRATCRREQSGWRVATADGSVHMPDSVGMRQLAALLECPHQEIPAVQLAGGMDVMSGGDAFLDEEARRNYSHRIEALRTELDMADAAGDATRSARAEEELRWLVTELTKATGLSGRPRRFADDAERARTSVRKALWRAIDRITALDPRLGGHLAGSVSTGTACCYRPEPEGLVTTTRRQLDLRRDVVGP